MKLTGVVERTFESRLVFRGYATIKNLVSISKPNYQYQRPVDKNREAQIVEFLKNNTYRFYTELLFGLEFNDERAISAISGTAIRGGVKLTDGIRITKSKFSFQDAIGENPTTKIISLEFDNNITPLSRIDGNHRLTAAEQIFNLSSDIINDTIKQQIGNLVVPFSILLQQKNEDSKKYESAIFYIINAKSHPLTDEENLKSLLQNGNFSESELENLFLDIPIAGLREIIEYQKPEMLPELSHVLNNNYYTCLHNLYKLFYLYEQKFSTAQIMSAFKVVENDYSDNEDLKQCNNVGLLTAFVYYYCQGKKVYQLFKRWVIANKIYEQTDIHATTILKIFDKIQQIKIKVFVAMPYYGKEELRTVNDIYQRALSSIRTKYNVDIQLPGKIMTYEGTTINIVNDIFDRLDNCDICFCDITGNNPNVTYEMGWARALKKHVVILKEEQSEEPKSDYKMDYYETYKKDASITLYDAIEKSVIKILTEHYGVVE